MAFRYPEHSFACTDPSFLPLVLLLTMMSLIWQAKTMPGTPATNATFSVKGIFYMDT